MTGIMRRCREKKMIKNDRICLHPGPRRALVSYSYFQLHSFLSEFYPWFLSIDNSLVIAEVYFKERKFKKGGGRRKRREKSGILRDGNSRRGGKKEETRWNSRILLDPITSSRFENEFQKRGSCRRNYESLPFDLLNILME